MRLRGALWIALVVLFGAVWATTQPALAHEVRPALLQLTETAPGRVEVLWKQPVVGDMAVRLVPHLSSGALDRPPDRESLSPGFLVKRWTLKGGAALDGQTVRIEGLSQSVTDVLLRVTPAKGETMTAVLKPAAPSLKLELSGPRGVAVPAYLKLGVEHILTGIDHLMFVLGLLLLIGPSWRIIKAVTAFTVAHSLTLALAALGFIRFPSALIEALVALSIVFVAVELARGPDAAPTVTRRWPWLIAFLFGLLHGLAFAGALAQIGLPPGAAAPALFLFNVGVELGQLAFIAVVVAIMIAVRPMMARAPAPAAAFARIAPVYAIGGAASFWLIERVLAAATA